MIGTSLRSIWMKADAAARSKVVIAPGGETIANLPREGVETMFATFNGTVIVVFILGVDDPDGAEDRLVL